MGCSRCLWPMSRCSCFDIPLETSQQKYYSRIWNKNMSIVAYFLNLLLSSSHSTWCIRCVQWISYKHSFGHCFPFDQSLTSLWYLFITLIVQVSITNIFINLKVPSVVQLIFRKRTEFHLNSRKFSCLSSNIKLI